jgi:phosphate transporter
MKRQDVLVLIGGGLSLGLAVESSGLLIAIGDRLTEALSSDLSVVLFAFSSLVAVLANFISSTVAAVILLPLVATVGTSIGHPKLLVTLCAFMTSGAMGLPVSSFPNANSMAVGVSCGSGKPEGVGDKAVGLLRNADFVRTGFPMAALVLLLVNSFGRAIGELGGW